MEIASSLQEKNKLDSISLDSLECNNLIKPTSILKDANENVDDNNVDDNNIDDHGVNDINDNNNDDNDVDDNKVDDNSNNSDKEISTKHFDKYVSNGNMVSQNTISTAENKEEIKIEQEYEKILKSYLPFQLLNYLNALNEEEADTMKTNSTEMFCVIAVVDISGTYIKKN